MALTTPHTSCTYQVPDNSDGFFPVDFQFVDVTDLLVQSRPTTDVPWRDVPSAQYSVIQQADGCGSVRLKTRPVKDSFVRIVRQTAVLQPATWRPGETVQVKTIERTLDRAFAILQERSAFAPPLPVVMAPTGGGTQSGNTQGTSGGSGSTSGSTGGSTTTGGGTTSSSSGYSLSLPWAREVWGPEEAVGNETRYAGHINVGGLILNMRVSHESRGKCQITVRVNSKDGVGGRVLATLESRLETQCYLAGFNLPAVLKDGDRIEISTQSNSYEEPRGLQIEFLLQPLPSP